jgi:hypothetical protein
MLGAAAALPLAARAPQNSPGAEQEINAAAGLLRSNFDAMKKSVLPMSVEPATVFRP